jgi:hypothetical protein
MPDGRQNILVNGCGLKPAAVDLDVKRIVQLTGQSQAPRDIAGAIALSRRRRCSQFRLETAFTEFVFRVFPDCSPGAFDGVLRRGDRDYGSGFAHDDWMDGYGLLFLNGHNGSFLPSSKAERNRAGLLSYHQQPARIRRKVACKRQLR